MRKIKNIASAVTVAMLILQSVSGVYAGWESDTDKTVNIYSTDFSGGNELSTSWSIVTTDNGVENNVYAEIGTTSICDMTAPYLLIRNDKVTGAVHNQVQAKKEFTIPEGKSGVVRATFKYSSNHGNSNAVIRLSDSNNKGILIGSAYAAGKDSAPVIVDGKEQKPHGSQENRVYVADLLGTGKSASYALGDGYTWDLGEDGWGKMWREVEIVANTSDQSINTTIAGTDISLGGGIYAVALTTTLNEASTNILKGVLPADMGSFSKFAVESGAWIQNGTETRIDDLSIEYTPVVFVDNKFTNRAIIRCGEEEIKEASQLGSEISIESKLFNRSLSDKEAAVLAVLYRNGYMINAAGAADKVPHSASGDENIYKQLDLSLITPSEDIFADMSLSVFTLDSFEKMGARCETLSIPENTSSTEFTEETTSPSINENTNKLTYCGITEPDSIVTYAVLKEGREITEITSAEELCKALYYFGSTKSNSGGEYAFDVKFAGTDAEYTLVINDSKKQRSYPITFKNKLADSIAESLSSVTDKEELKIKLDTFLEAIQFSNKVYNSNIDEIKSGDLFYNIFFNEIKRNSVSTTDEIVKDAKLSTLMFALNRENEQSGFERLLSENIDMVDVSRIWSNELYSDSVLTDESVKSVIFERFTKSALNNTAVLSDMGAFVDELGNSAVLAVCEKTVGAGAGGRVIELLNARFAKENASFAAAYNIYRNMSGEKKNAAASAIMGKSYENIEKLISAFSEAVTADSPSNNGGNGGSVKPSGGSGGSGAMILNPPSKEQQPELIPPSYNIPSKGEGVVFSDLSEAEWVSEFVQKLSERGIVSGDDYGKFYPNRPILREEFVKMLVKTVGLETLYVGSNFSDVPHDAWFYEYVSAAYANGIVNGIDDKFFGAGRNITREDLCTMLYRALEKYGVYIPKNEISQFADDAELSGYARTGVYALKQLGAIDGFSDGRFEPKRNASRAETAKILNIVLEYMDKEAKSGDKEESDK